MIVVEEFIYLAKTFISSQEAMNNTYNYSNVLISSKTLVHNVVSTIYKIYWDGTVYLGVFT